MCRILIVDDNRDVLDTVRGILVDAGYTARPAINEGQALEAIVQETFDLALIDVRLHGDDDDDESGLSLAMAVGAVAPHIRVILMTGYQAKVRQVVEALRIRGVMDYIEKSGDWHELLLKAINSSVKGPSSAELECVDIAHLHLSLAVGQPLMLRASGGYVCSTRSWKVLRVDAERYARRTELARQGLSSLRFQVAGIGDDLWRQIFSENAEITRIYSAASGACNSLALHFETPRELLSLPLEFMRSESPQDYLILQHPLSRFVCDAIPKRPSISSLTLASPRALRILIIASNTVPPLAGVDPEASAICDFWNSQQRTRVDIKLLSGDQATYGRVRSELAKPAYDIIHYAGHGFFDPSSPEESALIFWADEGKSATASMKANELKLLLDNSEAKLVYLSSCSGATTGSQTVLLDDDFLGLADAVAQAGVPSVVGYRWPVSDVSASRLAVAFYSGLLENGSPEIALWQARRELAASNRDDPTWLSPILIHQE